MKNGYRVSRATYHVRVSLLCIQLRKIVLVSIHVGKAIQVDRGFVVSEQKTSRVGLIDIVVEISTTSDRHRVPVETGQILKLARLKNACVCEGKSTVSEVR